MSLLNGSRYPSSSSETNTPAGVRWAPAGEQVPAGGPVRSGQYSDRDPEVHALQPEVVLYEQLAVPGGFPRPRSSG